MANFERCCYERPDSHRSASRRSEEDPHAAALERRKPIRMCVRLFHRFSNRLFSDAECRAWLSPFVAGCRKHSQLCRLFADISPLGMYKERGIWHGEAFVIASHQRHRAKRMLNRTAQKRSSLSQECETTFALFAELLNVPSEIVSFRAHWTNYSWRKFGKFVLRHSSGKNGQEEL